MTDSSNLECLRRNVGSLIGAGMLLSLISCGDGSAGTQERTDASPGGGETDSGALSSYDGAVGTLGTGGGTIPATNLGGMTSAGGATSMVPGTGGVTGSGGMRRTGGTRGARSGGTTGQAGRTSTGGATGTGGIIRTGGALGLGGTTRGAGGATSGPGRDGGQELAGDAGSPNIGTDATYPIAAGKPTVYLAGDSTVETYSRADAPEQGWGQRIAEFFTNDVVFVNESVGGRSSKSFIEEGRLEEIVDRLKPGDYIFAQWGINDGKDDPDRYTDPATTFRTYLKQYIDEARSKDAIPVLVTPTPKLVYKNGVFQNGFPDYCIAIKAVGKETNTPVIDLQTMGLEYYTSIGYDTVVETIAMPGPDVYHFRDTGAYQMARLVARGVHDIEIPISPFVRQDKL